MKAYYQGEIDRFCAIYAIINSVRLAAVKYHDFDFAESCDYYEYMVRYLYDKGIFLDVLNRGTSLELMDELLSVTNGYLQEKFGLRLLHKSPLRKKEANIDRVCTLLGNFLKQPNASCILRFYNNDVWDHWSVVERRCCNRLKLFDSYFYPHLKIGKCIWGEPFVNDGFNRFNQDGLILIKVVQVKKNGKSRRQK